MKEIRKTALCLVFLLLLCGCAGKLQNTGNGGGEDKTGTVSENAAEAEDGTGNAAGTSGTESSVIGETEEAKEPYTLTLGFAGDINLDEDWPTTLYLKEQERGIYDCIDPELIEELNSLDIFMLNNEFTYSDRGEPTAGKMYTFRAKPERVSVLTKLGTDIVLLANNHIFDYGEAAFSDTLVTLQEAGIAYTGAGENLEEACRPCYFNYDEISIAYVSATRAEKYRLTPEAGEASCGVLRCYEDALFLQVIAEAAAQADYVVASVHFGTEYEKMADDSQRELAYAMIDAGADAVIGTHAHVLQGIEFYKEKPIFYNLGNFWFNDKDLYSCVAELTVTVEPDASQDKVQLSELRFLPCTQYNCYTNWEKEGELREKILSYEEGISFGVSIDEEGRVTQKAEEQKAAEE